MLYTVGHTENYLKAMEEAAPDPIIKVGKGRDPNQPNYPGGIIFPTIADARQYLTRVHKEDIWSVFVVDCGFGDCYFPEGADYLHLLKDAPIVQIVDKAYEVQHV